MFVGYSLKNEAEEAIEKLPESMREKLKFLLTHSSSAETFQQQQQMVSYLQIAGFFKLVFSYFAFSLTLNGFARQLIGDGAL